MVHILKMNMGMNRFLVTLISSRIKNGTVTLPLNVSALDYWMTLSIDSFITTSTIGNRFTHNAFILFNVATHWVSFMLFMFAKPKIHLEICCKMSICLMSINVVFLLKLKIHGIIRYAVVFLHNTTPRWLPLNNLLKNRLMTNSTVPETLYYTHQTH